MSESDEYYSLRAKWYKKLAAEGFDDIEAFSAKGEAFDLLRGGRLNKSAQKVEDDFEYYRAVSHFLHDYEFPSEKHRSIWDFHSQGLSKVQISKETGYTYKSIQWVITKYRRILKQGLYGSKETWGTDRPERSGSDRTDRRKQSNRLRKSNKKNTKNNRSRNRKVREEEQRDDTRLTGVEAFGILFAGYSRRR